MKREAYPVDLRECTRALEGAARDLFSFAVVCMGGVETLAEQVVQDVLLLGLEREWFQEEQDSYSHQEFREDFFRELWSGASRAPKKVREGTDVPLGHEEMRFYKLPQTIRAALYLRTKQQFAYTTIARILGENPQHWREEVEKARAFLLGRETKGFMEEDF